MRIIVFNGLGQPSPAVPDGCVMLLVQGDDVSVVRLELLPPDALGPALDHALNADELASDARAALQSEFPDGLSTDRHWTLECPPSLALRAVFRSVGIRFWSLFCPAHDDYPEERPPIGQSLTRDNNHIHGWLEVRINGRVVPRMGFFGAGDVCLNTWLVELRDDVTKLANGPAETHVFDEGEQGAPAYTFRRDGETLVVSIDASAISDGPEEPSWQGEQCRFDHFRSEVEAFQRALRAELERALGRDRASSWWTAVTGAA